MPAYREVHSYNRDRQFLFISHSKAFDRGAGRPCTYDQRMLLSRVRMTSTSKNNIIRRRDHAYYYLCRKYLILLQEHLTILVQQNPRSSQGFITRNLGATILLRKPTRNIFQYSKRHFIWKLGTQPGISYL